MTKIIDIKKLVFGGILAAAIFAMGSVDTSAQSRREIERERQRIARENNRIQREQQRRYQRNNRQSGVTRRMENRINNANFTTGYNFGFFAGQNDRRTGKYNQSNVYRGTGVNPNDGDPTSSDYIYRQGYLEGYNDGFSGRRNY